MKLILFGFSVAMIGLGAFADRNFKRHLKGRGGG